MLFTCQLPSGKSRHFSKAVEAKSSFGTDLSAVFWKPKNNTLHLGSGRSGRRLLWHLMQPIEETEFHRGPVVGFSWCQNARCKSCGRSEGRRQSQMARPGLASTEPPSLQNQMETEVSGCIAAKQPRLEGKAANSVRVPVCKLDRR